MSWILMNNKEIFYTSKNTSRFVGVWSETLSPPGSNGRIDRKYLLLSFNTLTDEL